MVNKNEQNTEYLFINSGLKSGFYVNVSNFGGIVSRFANPISNNPTSNNLNNQWIHSLKQY